jgi:rhodanese-related sulfurtransferase
MAKKELEEQWIQVVLVDMIWHSVEWALPISNEMFTSGKYPKDTYFVLYCHSGWSSGYVQKQLKPQLPQYNFVNMDWGIMAYQIYKMNN